MGLMSLRKKNVVGNKNEYDGVLLKSWRALAVNIEMFCILWVAATTALEVEYILHIICEGAVHKMRLG